MSGYFKGNQHVLPRIKISRTSADLPFSITRITFPVCLSFAMTINKSQGQTFDRVGLLLKHPVFSHGQLYVAFSRVRNAKNLRIQIDPKCLVETNKNSMVKKILNVVYKEILNENNPIKISPKIR